MPIDLYYMPASPPCRTVLMVAKHLNIPLNLKLINIRGGDLQKPEFLKLNPQQCAPTIVDGDFSLWESRAIITYLANKYAPGNSIYPSDPKKRATIDRLLYFDLGTFYKAIAAYVVSYK